MGRGGGGGKSQSQDQERIPGQTLSGCKTTVYGSVSQSLLSCPPLPPPPLPLPNDQVFIAGSLRAVRTSKEDSISLGE